MGWNRGLWLVVVLLWVRTAAAVTITGKVTVDGRVLPGSVVYLETASGAAPLVDPPPRVVMDQRNLEFMPAVLPVVRGTTVDFTNNDDIQHNVFSPSVIAGKFDLGAYGPGATRAVKFDAPGEVLVLCNIHMEMEAHIVVLRDPYFARTERDGTYRIEAVPPGSYRVQVWHDRFLPGGTAVVPPDGELTLDLAVKK